MSTWNPNVTNKDSRAANDITEIFNRTSRTVMQLSMIKPISVNIIDLRFRFIRLDSY